MKKRFFHFIKLFVKIKPFLGFSFLDHEFAAIVATFAAYGVVDVPCAAVGADCECGDECFVMSATFSRTGVRLSAFRMCHFFIVLILLFYVIEIY